MDRPLLIVTGLAILAATAGCTTTTPRIPPAFHGQWSVDLSRCGDRESGLTRIIDATSITYFEAGDAVVAAAPLPNGGVSLLVDHEDYDGMGREHRMLVLSDNNQKLSFITDDTPGEVVLRCPQGTPDVR